MTSQVLSGVLNKLEDMKNDDKIREAGEELEKNLEREDVEKAIKEILQAVLTFQH